MDGVTFLRKIMTLRPMPVVMISTLTQAGAEITLEALEIGAVDFVAKPTSDVATAMAGLASELQSKVKAAARSRTHVRRSAPPARSRERVKLKHPANKVIVIGASTGGVEALKAVLMGLPSDCPPILITQHMPPRFTTAFAERLNRECPMTVSEAAHGDRIEPGHAYIAPGAYHLEVARQGSHLAVRSARRRRCPVIGRPSTSCSGRQHAPSGRSRSASFSPAWARTARRACSSCVSAGAITLGQDEASSLIYGMPRAAFELGAVARQYPLGDMADGIIEACNGEGGGEARGRACQSPEPRGLMRVKWNAVPCKQLH